VSQCGWEENRKMFFVAGHYLSTTSIEPADNLERSSKAAEKRIQAFWFYPNYQVDSKSKNLWIDQ